MQVVILWLINEHGEILLARRALHMSSDAGMWGPSVSGKVDAGESFEQAAVREAEEELGLRPEMLVPVFLHNEIYTDHPDGTIRELGLYYAFVSGDVMADIRLEPQEVAGIKWVTHPELQELLTDQPDTVLASSATALWQQIFNYLQPITDRASSNN